MRLESIEKTEGMWRLSYTICGEKIYIEKQENPVKSIGFGI